MAGILETVKLAGVLVLALPAALAGLELLVVRGEPTTGAVLLVLATGLVVVHRRLPLPSDLPGLAARRVGGAVLGKSDAESSADDGVGDDPQSEDR